MRRWAIPTIGALVTGGAVIGGILAVHFIGGGSAGSAAGHVFGNVFVSSHGSDSGGNCRRFSAAVAFPGDPATVCLTLDKADSLLQNGDIGLIAGGTYGGQTITRHTQRSAAASLRVVPGQTMTLNGITLQTQYLDLVGPFMMDGHEVDISNPTDNSAPPRFLVHDVSLTNFSSGIVSVRAAHVTLKNGVIGPWHVCTQGGEDGVQLSALFYSSAIQEPTRFITLDAVTVHDIDRWKNPAVGAASGVCSPHTDGIQSFGADHLTIKNSHIYRTATSILVSKPEGTNKNIEDNVTLTNNMFGETLEGGDGVLIGESAQNCFGTNTILVQNNTFGNNPGLAIGCAGTAAIVRNNILVGNLCGGVTRNIVYSYNVFPTGSDLSCTGTSHAKVCDPSYAHASRSTNGNYARTAGDTCATDAGDPENFTTPDIFGVTRPVGAAPDSAADEH